MRHGFAVEEVAIPSGGQTLYGELHEAVRPRGAVLLVHGFNSTREEFGHAPEWLAAAGYTSLAFDQRGFGKSGGEAGRTSVERAVADIRSAGQFLQRQAGRRAPLFIIGHSLGAAYVLNAIGRGAIDVTAAVVAHPLHRIFDELGPVQRGIYHVLGRWAERREARGRPPGTVPYRAHSRDLFVSIEAARAAGRQDFLLRRANLGNYRLAVTMAGAEWAASVGVPTLVVVSPHDRTVRPEHSMTIHDALAGAKSLLEHKGGHSCFRDLDGRFVVDGCIAWFDAHRDGGAKA